MEEWERSYYLSTAMMRRVSKYTGLDFNRVLELPYTYFLLLNRESWIDSYMQSEKGMEVLKNLWRLQQTQADVQAVREFQRERGEQG